MTEPSGDELPGALTMAIQRALDQATLVQTRSRCGDRSLMEPRQWTRLFGTWRGTHGWSEVELEEE